MLNARLAAASDVRETLISAEDAIDCALQQATALLNTMCGARTAANLPMHTASAEFEHIAQAVSMIGQARGRVLAAHQAFVDTRAKILPTIAWGDVGECPPGPSGELREPITPTLHAVA
jgi:hypothetical protein